MALPALAVKHPKFGDAYLGGKEHAQRTEMNALGMETRKLQNKGIERQQALDALKFMGNIATTAMNGQMEGEVDPQRWEEGLKRAKEMGYDTSQLEGNPQLAPGLARNSLTTYQQIGLENDRKKWNQRLKEFDITNQRAAEAHKLKMSGQLEKPTASMKDFEYAVKNGYKGSFADWKKVDNPGTTVNIGGQDISKIKEGPAKAAGFYERMQKSASEISSIKGVNPAAGRDTLKGFWQNIAPNEFQSPEFQQYEAAASEWIRAKLRKESGAAIGKEEKKEEFETYFPQPGDSDGTVKLKERLRATAEQAMKAESRGAHEALFPEKDGWKIEVVE